MHRTRAWSQETSMTSSETWPASFDFSLRHVRFVSPCVLSATICSGSAIHPARPQFFVEVGTFLHLVPPDINAGVNNLLNRILRRLPHFAGADTFASHHIHGRISLFQPLSLSPMWLATSLAGSVVRSALTSTPAADIVATESNEMVTIPGFLSDPCQLPLLMEKTQREEDLLMMSSLTYITQISPNV